MKHTRNFAKLNEWQDATVRGCLCIGILKVEKVALGVHGVIIVLCIYLVFSIKNKCHCSTACAKTNQLNFG